MCPDLHLQLLAEAISLPQTFVTQVIKEQLFCCTKARHQEVAKYYLGIHSVLISDTWKDPDSKLTASSPWPLL